MAGVYGIAVIGVGKIAQDQHLPAIAADPRFRLAATVDGRAVDEGVPHFDSLAALLASGVKVDAVAICTPPQARAAIAREAIGAGIATLLEKPPAATPGGFVELKMLAEGAGVPLFTAWHSRFAAMVSDARGWLEGRSVASGRITWRESARKWHPGQRWLWDAGGLGVFDPGINALSILTELLGDPVTVREAAFEVPENCDTPIGVRARLASGGATIAVDLDFREEEGEVWELELVAEDGGRMLLSRGGAAISIDGEAARTAPDGEYAGLYARFGELLAAGKSDADGEPLRIVADAFLIASWTRTDPYFD